MTRSSQRPSPSPRRSLFQAGASLRFTAAALAVVLLWGAILGVLA